jgi:hypothetical protein
MSGVWTNELTREGYPGMDGVDNLFDVFQKSVHAHPTRRCLGYRPSLGKDRFGPYQWLTYEEVRSCSPFSFLAVTNACTRRCAHPSMCSCSFWWT